MASKQRIRRDSVVTVLSGEHKGASGKVLKIDREKNRVLVEGVNLRKRAKRRSPENPEGGIVEQECPIHVSNVMLTEEHEARQARRTAAAGQ